MPRSHELPKTLRRCLLRGTASALMLFAIAWAACPFPRAALESFPQSTLVTDRHGRPLRIRLGPGDRDCRPVYRYEAGDWVAQAVIAAEDERFWRHPGIDPLAILRAAGQNLAAGRTISGASTISTQVIRLLQPRRRTLATKIIEACRALQMEALLSKREILAQYLNRAPFGSNIIGVEAASRRYFGKGPRELSLAEAALLAGLPQSPSRLRPDRHPAAAQRRQAYVLQRMVQRGMISDRERRQALAQPLAVRPAPYPFAAPHFCELALRGATDGVLRTTLDSTLQSVAEAALRRQAFQLSAAGIRGGAVVILEVNTGAVRALVGSPDFHDVAGRGAVNGATAPRAAGSTLKPFLYALAYDHGILTPNRVLADVPKVYRDYRPDNFDDRFLGLVPAREALILSLNMPALALEERLGVETLQHALLAAGLKTLNRAPDYYGLGFALGSGDVTLLDLANAYACLARGGNFLPWRLVELSEDGSPCSAVAAPLCRGVRTTRRQSAAATVPSPPHVFSPEAAWLIADTLSGQERAADAVGHLADVRLPRLAWKTGTSSGFRDAWTIAYNPDYVVAVWFGDPEGSGSEELVGKLAAAPVAWDIFRALYPHCDAPWFERPARLQRHMVCAASGCLAGADCPSTVEDWYVRGVTLQEPCRVHRRMATGTIEVWPPEVAAFMKSAGSPKTCELPIPVMAAPPWPAVAFEQRRTSAIRIHTPADGAVYRFSRDLDADRQQLALDAASPSSAEPLYWFVNGRYLGPARANRPLNWSLTPGHYAIVCADARGHSDSVGIVVE